MGYDFTLTSVDEKVRSRRVRRSKYDALLDEFLGRGSPIVRVDGFDRGAGYLSLVIGRRIERRGLADRVRASCAGGCLYLERVND